MKRNDNFKLSKIDSKDEEPRIHKIEALNKHVLFNSRNFLVTSAVSLMLLNGCSDVKNAQSPTIPNTPSTSITQTAPTTTPKTAAPDKTIAPPATPAQPPAINNTPPPSLCACDADGGGIGGGSFCSCDTVCTCNLIYN
ncbi:MAG: hypothetical protein Q8920_07510 [Bacillota bacterium]|nr:hypothetical protein [Bacillota bacterium]